MSPGSENGAVLGIPSKGSSRTHQWPPWRIGEKPACRRLAKICRNLQNLWLYYLNYKKDFADVIKDLEMGKLSWLARQAWSNHKSHFKRGMRTEVREKMVLAWKMVERATRQERQIGPKSWVEARRGILPWSLQKERSPFQTSNLKNCERIIVCYFKPLSWWQFVRAAMGNKFTFYDLEAFGSQRISARGNTGCPNMAGHIFMPKS